MYVLWFAYSRLCSEFLVCEVVESLAITAKLLVVNGLRNTNSGRAMT